MNENTQTLLRTIVHAMQDKKADRIVSLDLTALDGAVCDAFVICQAESTTQVAAITAGVEELTLREIGEKPYRIQGLDNALWVAMDYGNVMVHIFQSEMRDFYRLEELWADGELTRHEDQY
ncbi:ribosome silencing factor [uncultured Rikenella sp.]|uniref:ribosome silencing factor n=1 Tax=uncultured Rikenella sp. TaxID=368003 RepID=UPI0026389580|nr:ribosome silencing factor [uncultured Rikenella sp.]